MSKIGHKVNVISILVSKESGVLLRWLISIVVALNVVHWMYVVLVWM